MLILTNIPLNALVRMWLRCFAEGIFVFLMGGLGMAGLVLCIEILAYSINRSRREKVLKCIIGANANN